MTLDDSLLLPASRQLTESEVEAFQESFSVRQYRYPSSRPRPHMHETLGSHMSCCSKLLPLKLLLNISRNGEAVLEH